MRTVRYGIVGFGRFAERAIAPAIMSASHSQLVALQKRSLAAAQESARALSIPLAFSSVDDLVGHPDIDAVFIVSANVCHYAETIAAARRGKHVLVEKPMAMNGPEAEEMMRACADHGVKLMVGHMVRLSPVVQRIRDLVQSGTLGRIHLARADFVYDARASQRTWLYDRSVAGGGPVFDIGVHCIDTLRFVLQDEIVSVESELEPRPTPTSTEASAQLLLRFDRGTIGSVYCSFVAPYRRSLIELVGTEGSATATDFTLSEKTLHLDVTLLDKGRGMEGWTEDIAVPNLYRQEVSLFSQCIIEDTEPPLTGMNGLQNQRVLDLALKGA